MTKSVVPELILNVAHALGREPLQKPKERPPLPSVSESMPIEQALELLISEVTKLSGEFLRLRFSEINQALTDLVRVYSVQRAAVWRDEETSRYELPLKLANLGVEVVSPEADKHVLATCDLGITIADFFLADTGTLGLTSSAQKPKAVSLLPLVHLAIITSSNWRTSLSEALVEFKHSPHLTLISGPSRTSDIELILTLGVHGPKHLVVWYLEES